MTAKPPRPRSRDFDPSARKRLIELLLENLELAERKTDLRRGARRTKRSETTWPPDLGMGDEERTFAEERGYRGTAATRLWESFESRSKAKALKYADWRQAWRNYVLKQIEFDAKAGRLAYATAGSPQWRPPDV